MRIRQQSISETFLIGDLFFRIQFRIYGFLFIGCRVSIYIYVCMYGVSVNFGGAEGTPNAVDAGHVHYIWVVVGPFNILANI